MGLRPRPRWGKLTELPRPSIAGFKGPTEERRQREGRGSKGKGEETISPPFLSHFKTWLIMMTMLKR